MKRQKLYCLICTLIVSILILLSSCSFAPEASSPPAGSDPADTSLPSEKDGAAVREGEEAQTQEVEPPTDQTPPETISEIKPLSKDSSSPSAKGAEVPPVRRIQMTAKKFEFSPSVISAKKGDHVVITIKSVDVPHGFALPDFGVNVPLTPGEEKVVEFDADKTGEFEFFCSIVCGSGHGGMRGKLMVEE